MWSGKEFVDVNDIAYFRGILLILFKLLLLLLLGNRLAWLPLGDGRLLCDTTISPGCIPR